jgi:hypothetical protein
VWEGCLDFAAQHYNAATLITTHHMHTGHFHFHLLLSAPCLQMCGRAALTLLRSTTTPQHCSPPLTCILLTAIFCCLPLPPDVRQSCLDFAAQHYKAATLLTTPQQNPADVAQQLQHKLAAAAAAARHQSTAADHADLDALTGIQPDVVIDCVGVQQTLEAAVRAVAPGGKIVLVGMGSEQLQLPATLLTCKEVDLLGSFRWAPYTDANITCY